MCVKYQICEQASNTLHHINRAKIFTENFAMTRLRDILIEGWGPTDPHIYSSKAHKTENGTQLIDRVTRFETMEIKINFDWRSR